MLSLPTPLRGRVKAFTVLLPLLLLLGLRGYAAENVSLYSFIPLDCPGVVSVDVPQLWNATADFRTNAMIGLFLQAMQDDLKLSIEEDLLPWAGQAAFAITDVRPKEPGYALFLQVRDPDRMLSPARLALVMQQLLQSGDQTKWLAMEIKGVPIRRTEIPRGKSVLKVAMMTQDGWLGVAFGDGVIRKVIDARNGSIRTLENHPLYQRAMGNLPAGAIGGLCVNGQGIVAQMARTNPALVERYEDSEVSKFFIAGAATMPNNVLQVDANYCTLSLPTQKMLKKINADAGAISGASLAQLPDGAFATLIINKPDVWLEAIEAMILDSAGDPDAREMMAAGMAEFNTVRDVLKRFNGELAVGGAWREGKGFGVTVAGQTATEADAAATGDALNGFMEKMIHMQTESKDGLYMLPDTAGESEMFPTLVCWKASKQWLRGASHPDWLAPKVEQPALQLPEIAKDANLALFGNYSFVSPFMTSIGAGEALPYLSMMNLDKGEWGIAMKIDPDGCAVRCRLTGGLTTFGMVGAVLFPVFAKSREQARTTQSVNNLRQLALAVLMYTQDNNDKLPALKTPADMKKALGEYLGGTEQMFTSPRTGELYEPNPFVSGKSIGVFDNPATMIVFYEKTPAGDGSRCTAFLDGHVEVIQAEEWDAVKKKAKLP